MKDKKVRQNGTSDPWQREFTQLCYTLP